MGRLTPFLAHLVSQTAQPNTISTSRRQAGATCQPPRLLHSATRGALSVTVRRAPAASLFRSRSRSAVHCRVGPCGQSSLLQQNRPYRPGRQRRRLLPQLTYELRGALCAESAANPRCEALVARTPHADVLRFLRRSWISRSALPHNSFRALTESAVAESSARARFPQAERNQTRTRLL